MTSLESVLESVNVQIESMAPKIFSVERWTSIFAKGNARRSFLALTSRN